MKTRQRKDFDSAISGLGCLKADQEEEISKLLLPRVKHGEERLGMKRQKHLHQIGAVSRERDLERNDFQLRFEEGD